MKSAANFLARPVILFYALPWLMLLLTLGTLAQREMGLYAAQKMYFSSWFFWLGPLPLPGTYLTIGLIFFSLLCKFLYASPWRREHTGIIITHLGVLLLLLGGIVTAFTAKEGFMRIAPGESQNIYMDYYQREFAVTKNGEDFLIVPHQKLYSDKVITHPELPFHIHLDLYCLNCKAFPNGEPSEKDRGTAEKIKLTEDNPRKEYEVNQVGAQLTISGLDEDQNGQYIILEGLPHIPSLSHKNDIYEITLRRAQTSLPFSVELENFERDYHPGTQTARSYQSDVIVHDMGVSWPVNIHMNAPLRYKGYTFYQSSFIESPLGDITVLNVVRNSGQIFPYISTAIILLGLLIHVILRLRQSRAE